MRMRDTEPLARTVPGSGTESSPGSTSVAERTAKRGGSRMPENEDSVGAIARYLAVLAGIALTGVGYHAMNVLSWEPDCSPGNVCNVVNSEPFLMLPGLLVFLLGVGAILRQRQGDTNAV